MHVPILFHCFQLKLHAFSGYFQFFTPFTLFILTLFFFTRANSDMGLSPKFYMEFPFFSEHTVEILVLGLQNGGFQYGGPSYIERILNKIKNKFEKKCK